MTRPTLPADGTDPWGQALRDGIFDVSDRLDADIADLGNFKQQTPSNEDLMFVWAPPAQYNSTITTTFDFIVFAAPMALTLNGVSLCWDDSPNFSGLTASDTNYWKIDIWKKGAGAIASRSTQATGALSGGSIVTETDWNFDAATWSTRDFNKGDVLKMQVTPTGTPAALGLEFTAAIRYQRKAS